MLFTPKRDLILTKDRFRASYLAKNAVFRKSKKKKKKFRSVFLFGKTKSEKRSSGKENPKRASHKKPRSEIWLVCVRAFFSRNNWLVVDRYVVWSRQFEVMFQIETGSRCCHH